MSRALPAPSRDVQRSPTPQFRRFTEFLDLDRNDALARVCLVPCSLITRALINASRLSQKMSMDYKQAIQKMVQVNERRLIVNLDDLRDYDREFCDG